MLSFHDVIIVLELAVIAVAAVLLAIRIKPGSERDDEDGGLW